MTLHNHQKKLWTALLHIWFYLYAIINFSKFWNVTALSFAFLMNMPKWIVQKKNLNHFSIIHDHWHSKRNTFIRITVDIHNIFASLCSVHNKISLSSHEQVCLIRLNFKRYFSYHQANDGRSISRNVA